MAISQTKRRETLERDGPGIARCACVTRRVRTARGQFAVPKRDCDGRGRFTNAESDGLAGTDALPHSNDPADL